MKKKKIKKRKTFIGTEESAGAVIRSCSVNVIGFLECTKLDFLKIQKNFFFQIFSPKIRT